MACPVPLHLQPSRFFSTLPLAHLTADHLQEILLKRASLNDLPCSSLNSEAYSVARKRLVPVLHMLRPKYKNLHAPPALSKLPPLTINR